MKINQLFFIFLIPTFCSFANFKSSLFNHKKLQPPFYEVKSFDLNQIHTWLSQEQINEHKTLYKGYVDKRNQITQSLLDADHKVANNATYSVFRGLKSSETFALNGMVLHELYFQNMSSKKTKVGPIMYQLILDNFGSFESFKEDLIATALSARGWAITYFTPDDQRLHNILLDSHNNKVPAFAIPLIVLDVYEHAYFIDYGTRRALYLDNFFKYINWDIVENRAKFIKSINWNNFFTPSMPNNEPLTTSLPAQKQKD